MGHYCPEGTGAIQPECPAGKYSLTRGLREAAECHACPEGFFCEDGTANYLENPCPKGHYCPAGTKKATDNPCPAGKFTALQRYSNVCVSTACHKYLEPGITVAIAYSGDLASPPVNSALAVTGVDLAALPCRAQDPVSPDTLASAVQKLAPRPAMPRESRVKMAGLLVANLLKLDTRPNA